MLVVLALLVAIGCAAASERRVWLARHATAIDPDQLLASLTRAGRTGRDGVPVLREAAAHDPRADWERDLAAALSEGDDQRRAALVNEQLTELGYRLDRWSRVPRVCARVATSSGFMLATLVLRRGLADTGAIPQTVDDLVFHGFVGEAVAVVGLGIAGGLLSVAAHRRAARVAKARMVAADRLVERLEEDGAAPA